MAPPRRKTKVTRRKRARRTRKAIVQHVVDAELHQPFRLTFEGSALKFVIRANGRKLGTLTIGKGSIGWKGRSDKRVLPLGWTQLVRLLDQERRERTSRRR